MIPKFIAGLPKNKDPGSIRKIIKNYASEEKCAIYFNPFRQMMVEVDDICKLNANISNYLALYKVLRKCVGYRKLYVVVLLGISWS